jgi:hypothetical protein
MVGLLDDGAELASRMCNDPFFRSPEDRVTATLTAARIISANASLGRALASLVQVEQRRRTIIEHAGPATAWNDSISIQEAKIIRNVQFKMWRYLKVFADDTLDPPIAEAEEAAAQAATQNATTECDRPEA